MVLSQRPKRWAAGIFPEAELGAGDELTPVSLVLPHWDVYPSPRL
jgi:hypothetical protein